MLRGARQVWIYPVEETGSDCRIGLSRPELPDFRFPEEVIAAEHFIGTFTGQNRLDSGTPDHFGEEKEWGSRRSQQRPATLNEALSRPHLVYPWVSFDSSGQRPVSRADASPNEGPKFQTYFIAVVCDSQ